MLRVITLPQDGLTRLQAEAHAEGYAFIEGLIQEWASAYQRFDGPGELLCGAFDRGKLIAVGGLTRDPFAAGTRTGRIRKVYVRAPYRNKGVGSELVLYLVERARLQFEEVCLRAQNAEAARLYERLGFLPFADANATHKLVLRAPSTPETTTGDGTQVRHV